MGKKKGQQQRVKGNVLPSSSVRSAELLTREGVNAGLGLFQSLPSLALGSLPELAGLDSISNIELRTALKKLYKRDVTTKLKGLAEFSDLCRSVEQHDILAMLPYWPRIFNRLFEESDRRVRENAQKAMSAVVTASGKNLALQLKNLMGSWFVSQCDPYSPAALAAENSINRAFAGDKKLSAFAFCREEILNCIKAYVFAPQGKKDKTADENGNNSQRMVASCLEALSLFLRTVTKHKPSDGEVEAFLDNASFWKFQKHPSPSVRGGYYSVLESLCIVCPTLANKHTKELCRSIFHRLDDDNVIVCKPLYAAAVAASAKCDNWHTEIDMQKGLLAGLRNILKMGCYGLCGYVLPTLLPIFGSIPFGEDSPNHFTKISEALRICVVHETIKQSKRGSEIAITSYMEILKLFVKRLSDNISDNNVLTSFCDSIIQENILFLLRMSWSNEGSKFTTRYSLEIIPLVIQAWVSRFTNGDLMHRPLCIAFWERLNDLIKTESFKPNNMIATEHIATFLHRLGLKPTRTAKNSVKFQDASHIISKPTDLSNTTNAESYCCEESMQACINKVVIDCKLFFPLKPLKQMLKLQKDMYEKLGNSNVFSELAVSLPTANQPDRDNVSLFLNSMVVPDILEILKTNSDKDIVDDLSVILACVVRNCQEGKLPLQLSPFLNGQNPLYKTVLVQCLLTLSYPIELKTGPWLYSIFSENCLLDSGILESLYACVTMQDSPEQMSLLLDTNRCWEFFEKLVSSSYQDSSGRTAYICSNEMCYKTMTALYEKISSRKGHLECYETAIMRYTTIMMRIVGRKREWSGENWDDDCENLYERLMTDLYELSFVAHDTSGVIESFQDLFSHAVEGSQPFSKMSRLNMCIYLESLGDYVSRRIPSDEENVPSFISNAKAVIGVIAQSLGDNDHILSLLQALLPSLEKWEQLREFDLSSVKIDTIGCCLLSHIEVQRTADALRSFRELLDVITASIDESIDLTHSENYLLLLEESTILCTVSQDSMSVFDRVSCLVKSTFATRVISKSKTLGGVWAFSMKQLDWSFDNEHYDALIDQFLSSLKKSDIDRCMFQSLRFSLERFGDDAVLKILRAINDIIANMDPQKASVSELYAICFGLNAVCDVKTVSDSDAMAIFHELLLKWKRANVMGFLDDESDITQEEVTIFKNSIAKFYAHLIVRSPDFLGEEDWDFVQCSLLSWIEGVAKYVSEFGGDNASALALLSNSCKLLKVVVQFMSSSTAVEDPTIPSNLTSEWNGFFSNAIDCALVKIFVNLRELPVPLCVLNVLCECVKTASEESILSSVAELKPKLTANSALPEDVQTIVNHLCLSMFPDKKMFDGRRRQVFGVTAYVLLIKILDRLSSPETDSVPDEVWNVLRKLFVEVAGVFEVEEVTVPKSTTPVDDETDSEESDDAEDFNGLTRNATVWDAIETDSVAVVLYFLAWDVIIKFTKFVHPDKRSTYVNDILRQSSPNISEDLLPHLFKIMVGRKSHFRTAPDLSAYADLDMESIEHIAASLYKDFLLEMPAASRAWFNDLPKVVRSRVYKFTSSNVSPVLIENEFKAIRATVAQQNEEGMEISAKPGVREVHASYQINELKMEISVCLPQNHPLGPIVVNTEKRAGVVVSQWRYWILQITTFLQYQNGGIIDGLLMWKEKVDKKFEGMEECMICFSLVHGSNQSLPKLKCKTCKKKYHAQCLYKWFDTSNNSTCPLCRSPMIFR